MKTQRWDYEENIKPVIEMDQKFLANYVPWINYTSFFDGRNHRLIHISFLSSILCISIDFRSRSCDPSTAILLFSPLEKYFWNWIFSSCFHVPTNSYRSWLESFQHNSTDGCIIRSLRMQRGSMCLSGGVSEGTLIEELSYCHWMN